VRPVEPDGASSIYHLYVIRTSHRQELSDDLNQDGIQTLVHYPVPVHQQPVYRTLPFRYTNLETTERYSEEVLSLPIHARLTKDQQARVVSSIIRSESGRPAATGRNLFARE